MRSCVREIFSSQYCWFSHHFIPRFSFHDALKQLKTNFRTNFPFKRLFGFVIEYAWISKPLRDKAFTWRPRELSCRLKNWPYFRKFCYLDSSCIRKSINLMFMSFFEECIHAFVAKLGNKCFCWFEPAMLELIKVSTSMASPYKFL